MVLDTPKRGHFSLSAWFPCLDKRLLLVGSGFSAEDIAVMSVKAGATGVTVSYLDHSLKVGLPPQIEERPILENINGRTVK